MWQQDASSGTAGGYDTISQQQDKNMVPRSEYDRLKERLAIQEETADNLKFCILTIEAEVKLEAEKELKSLKSDLNFKSQELMTLRKEIDNLKRRSLGANPPSTHALTQSSSSSIASAGLNKGGSMSVFGGVGIHTDIATSGRPPSQESSNVHNQMNSHQQPASNLSQAIPSSTGLTDCDIKWQLMQSSLRAATLLPRLEDLLFRLRQLLSLYYASDTSDTSKRRKVESGAEIALKGYITTLTQFAVPSARSNSPSLKNLAGVITDVGLFLISYDHPSLHTSQQRQNSDDEKMPSTTLSLLLETLLSCVVFLADVLDQFSAEEILSVVHSSKVVALSTQLLSKFDAVAGDPRSSLTSNQTTTITTSSSVAIPGVLASNKENLRVIHIDDPFYFQSSVKDPSNGSLPLIEETFLNKLLTLIRQLVLFSHWYRSVSDPQSDDQSAMLRLILQLRNGTSRVIIALSVGSSGARLLHDYNCASYILGAYSDSEIRAFLNKCTMSGWTMFDGIHGGKTEAIQIEDQPAFSTCLPPLLDLIADSGSASVVIDESSSAHAIVIERMQMQARMTSLLTFLVRDSRVFELFVRSQSTEIRLQGGENENENDFSSPRTFLQKLVSVISLRKSIQPADDKSVEVSLRLSEFQLEICHFLCTFIREFESEGLTVILGLPLTDKEMATVSTAKSTNMHSSASPVKVTSIFSVASRHAAIDTQLVRACAQLWLDSARALDQSAHYEKGNNTVDAHKFHRTNSAAMHELEQTKQKTFSTMSDIVFILTQFLDSIAERVSTADWTFLTGDLKALIHAQIWVWNAEKRHPSLKRCDEHYRSIDAGGVDLADYDDD